MITLFYLIYAIFTIALVVDMIYIFLPRKIVGDLKDQADDLFGFIFFPQAIMTIINLLFIYPSTL